MLLLALLISTSLHAAPNMFEQFKTSYAEEGTLPLQREAVGWRVGRCYYAGEPTKAYSGIFFGVTGTTQKPNGPLKIILGPPKEFLSPEDVFDNPSSATLNYLQVNNIDKDYADFTPAVIHEQSLSSRYSRNNSEYRVRISADRKTFWGIVLSGDTVRAACRFYIKVK